MVHDSPSGAAEVFHQPPGGAGAVGCLALFLGPPALGVVGVVYRNFGLVAGVLGVAAVALALGAAYAFFNEDCTVTLDARGLRLTHRKSFLGLRGPEKLAWEIPRAALTEARELTKYTPGRNGGWSTNKKLHLPHGVVLEPALPRRARGRRLPAAPGFAHAPSGRGLSPRRRLRPAQPRAEAGRRAARSAAPQLTGHPCAKPTPVARANPSSTRASVGTSAASPRPPTAKKGAHTAGGCPRKPSTKP